MTVSKLIPSSNINNLIDAAIKHASEDGYAIDTQNTANTLKQIDDILLNAHRQMKEIKKLSNSKNIIEGMAIEYASLLYKLIKNQDSDAKWYYNHSHIGENTFPLQLKNGNVVFPFAWALKRIIDGESESVNIKYEQLIQPHL